jgi:uncharacterized DUF497 family protein
MEFEFDEAKRLATVEKHGLDFWMPMACSTTRIW